MKPPITFGAGLILGSALTFVAMQLWKHRVEIKRRLDFDKTVEDLNDKLDAYELQIIELTTENDELKTEDIESQKTIHIWKSGTDAERMYAYKMTGVDLHDNSVRKEWDWNTFLEKMREVPEGWSPEQYYKSLTDAAVHEDHPVEYDEGGSTIVYNPIHHIDEDEFVYKRDAEHCPSKHLSYQVLTNRLVDNDGEDYPYEECLGQTKYDWYYPLMNQGYLFIYNEEEDYLFELSVDTTTDENTVIDEYYDEDEDEDDDYADPWEYY